MTGDVAIHDLGRAGGETWLVATRFSCLATLDEAHSFVPRWRPPWISALSPDDRCHLNGLCVVDGRPAYVTALARTDTSEGWREHRRGGGCVVDVASSEVVASGLSMPHSPRWHAGALWVLDSGRGALARISPGDGRVDVVAEVPGFARGLAFAGPFAFVGLSQIRERSVFADLPLLDRELERRSGVWVVDVERGAVVAFLRFEELVQELFEVALLPGIRFPEVAELGGELSDRAYALPDEALADVAREPQ